MPGHEDPEGVVLYDEKGRAYFKVIREESKVEEVKPKKKKTSKKKKSNPLYQRDE